MTLDTLPIGKDAVITKVGGQGALRCRFLDMVSPTVREESFFRLNAVAGSSAISTTSVAHLISTPVGSVFSPQSRRAFKIASV